MRLDKFLQVSRLVRRRTLANGLCHAGRVLLNGKPAGPAMAVRPGDLVTVEFAARRLRARVRVIPGTPQDGQARVEILEDTVRE